jgi:predicted nucleic acid-binding protein
MGWAAGATARRLEIAGTLAVLMRASLRGHFALPDAIDRLRQCGFRMSKSVESAILAYYNQQSQGS